jgi:hypothetical protein
VTGKERRSKKHKFVLKRGLRVFSNSAFSLAKFRGNSNRRFNILLPGNPPLPSFFSFEDS